MARTLPFTLLLALLLLPHRAGSQPKTDGPPPFQQPEATRKMVDLLKKVSDTYNSGENILSNTQRVKYLTEEAKKNPGLRIALYQEMVNAGMTEQGIEGFKQLLAEPQASPALKAQLQGMLGVAYLRLGEQENCVINHTSQSCLIPIQKGGVHSLQRGSRGAIEVYSAMLRDNPQNLKAKWLLNIAYMTLGEYPAKVPQEWLLPESIFQSEYNLPRFTDIAPAIGLGVPRLSGGCCVEDFDNDGDIDIIASSWGVNDPLHYYRNNGDGTFSEQADAIGLTGITGGLNMFHADYNNDGYADVFITRGAWMGIYGKQPNSLLRNNKDGTFTDVTIEAGVLSYHPTEAAAWGDFDNDGWLDLFIGNETTFSSEPSELYHNNRNGTFTNIAHETGMDVQGIIKAVVWGDYDNDGLIDIYMSSLGEPNRLMKNNGKKNGKWSFTDVAKKAGVDQPLYSFPAFFFDYDNDGWLDLFVSDFGGRPSGSINGLPALMDVIEPVVNDYLGRPAVTTVPRLYHNNGNGTFTDMAKEMNLDKTLFGMGCNYGDLDNDGYLDIYIGTGHPSLEALIPNRMFRNAEGKVFQDVTTAGGFGHLQKGHGIAWADIDNDGDQDIFEVMGGAYEADVAPMVLFQNPGNSNHWTTLMLEGTKANRMATGARIKVTVQRADGTHRDIHMLAGTGASFGSSSLQQEIGLGDAESIESITIDWPGSHTKQTISNPAMDRVLKIREGNNTVAVVESRMITMPSANASSGHQHMHDHDAEPHNHQHGH